MKAKCSDTNLYNGTDLPEMLIHYQDLTIWTSQTFEAYCKSTTIEQLHTPQPYNNLYSQALISEHLCQL